MKMFKIIAYVFQSLALYALTIKLFIFCMCLFQDLALYALAHISAKLGRIRVIKVSMESGEQAQQF